MNPRELEAGFLAFLRQERVDLAAAPPSIGLQAVFRFYRDVRADGCEPNSTKDMILYQWGTYDWGNGEAFEVDLTRQVILPDEEDDEAIWQLHVTYRYEPSAELRSLGKGDQWSSDFRSLDRFIDFVTSTPVYAAIRDRRASELSVYFECAG